MRASRTAAIAPAPARAPAQLSSTAEARQKSPVHATLGCVAIPRNLYKALQLRLMTAEHEVRLVHDNESAEYSAKHRGADAPSNVRNNEQHKPSEMTSRRIVLCAAAETRRSKRAAMKSTDARDQESASTLLKDVKRVKTYCTFFQCLRAVLHSAVLRSACSQNAKGSTRARLPCSSDELRCSASLLVRKAASRTETKSPVEPHQGCVASSRHEGASRSPRTPALRSEAKFAHL